MKVGTDAVLLGCLADVSGHSILEIGCGCGVISLMLAQRFPAANITAIDIHKASTEEATQNFKNSPWHNRLHADHTSLQELAETGLQTFDVIISNPPFFSKSLHSPDADRTNARHTTTLTYDDLVRCSEKLLTPQGRSTVIIPTLELPHFKQSIAQSKLHIHEILHIFGVDRKLSKRVIVECGFEQKTVVEQSFYLHNSHKTNHPNNPYNYSDEYFALVKDFLCIGGM
jgi:tRNA1Val (adenine37-N6)-methyltransferase